METENVARLVQPIGSITTQPSPNPGTDGTTPPVLRTRKTWLGRGIAAMVCSGAVVAISIAPMAAGSTLRGDHRTAINDAVNAELGRLQDTGGIAAGTMLGMENFLRDFPRTATATTVSERASNDVVNAELGRLQDTGGIAAGTMLGMEGFLRVFPPTA